MQKGFAPILIILIMLLAGVGYFVFQNKPQAMPAPSGSSFSTNSPAITDLSASFEIYTNGTLRIFTDSKYHNLSPDVFIEVGSPNMVHVKKAGTLWNDFFKTLPMSLTKECLVTGTKQTFCTGEGGNLKFYINGIEDKDALDKIINEGDILLVKYGK